MAPRLSVAPASCITLPAFFGVYAKDQSRQACGSWSLPSEAGDQVAPPSSVISTFATSGAPENANPRIVADRPTRASDGDSVMLDLTQSAVTGVISAGWNATPCSPGVFG